MKITSLTFIIIGLICTLMAALTALEMSPGFVDFGINLDNIGIDSIKIIFTTAFWGGLSGLAMLAAIAFGVITNKE